jgi:hypothetical protein
MRNLRKVKKDDKFNLIFTYYFLKCHINYCGYINKSLKAPHF